MSTIDWVLLFYYLLFEIQQCAPLAGWNRVKLSFYTLFGPLQPAVVDIADDYNNHDIITISIIEWIMCDVIIIWIKFVI